MESTLQKPALWPGDLSMPRAKGMVIGFWIVTALFCLQIGFTAYAQLRLPQVSEAFTHLGFPAWFRVELSWAKLLGVVLLLAPMPARLKEWAYAGFAITLGSALIAHLSVGDGPEAWGPAAEMNSPSVEASGRWAALLIRLASRSRHRRDSAMSQRYTSINAHLRKAPAFAQPIIEHLREVAHAACPEMSGTSRRRT